jgi:hypothetical protein
MSEMDFNDFVNNALLAADEAPSGWFDLSNHFREANPEFPISTINDVRSRLAAMGYGKTHTDEEPPRARRFKINHAGRARAAELRRVSEEALVQRDGVTIHNHVSVNPQITNKLSAGSPNMEPGLHARSNNRAAWIAVLVSVIAIGVTVYLDYN